MGLFENMLSGNESLFLNPVALDFDYIPKFGRNNGAWKNN